MHFGNTFLSYVLRSFSGGPPGRNLYPGLLGICLPLPPFPEQNANPSKATFQNYICWRHFTVFTHLSGVQHCVSKLSCPIYNTKAKWAHGILNIGVFLTGLEDALNEDSDSDTDFNFDEEAIITYYYNRGFEYNEILGFLEKHHNNCISYSTLLRRLKQYGLSRRSQPSEDLLKHVREGIKEIIDGPGSMGG